MGLRWCHPAIAHLKPGWPSTRLRRKAQGRGMGSLCATAHARWVSVTLVVNPSEGLGCSYGHLMSIFHSRKPLPCGSLWCSPGRRRQKAERNQEKGNSLPTAPRHSFCGPSVVSHRPGQTRSVEAAVPPQESPQPGGHSTHLTWLLPAQPAAISSEPHCSDPERQPDGSGGLG